MKRTKYFFVTMLSLFAGLGLWTSCDDDDSYSLNDYYASIVTVQVNDNGGSYWLKQDDGDLLWPVNQGYIPNYNQIDGLRGVATYNIVGGPDNQFDYLIRLVSFSSILTKPVVNLTEANKDSIIFQNQDPTTIREGWIAGGFINLIFDIRVYEKTHFVNLVQVDTVAATPLAEAAVQNPSNGVWSLEFIHNANGDRYEKGRLVRNLVSFIVPDSINVSELKSLDVKYEDANGNEQIFVITDISTENDSDQKVRLMQEAITSPTHIE